MLHLEGGNRQKAKIFSHKSIPHKRLLLSFKVKTKCFMCLFLSSSVGYTEQQEKQQCNPKVTFRIKLFTH